jgi:hypothetical protein
MGAEDFVSETLIKDSPHVQTKKVSKNEQFMMHVRSTLNIDNISNTSSISIMNPLSFKNSTDKGQRTVLFIKETNDTDPDYLNMEIKQFLKMEPDEL